MPNKVCKVCKKPFFTLGCGSKCSKCSIKILKEKKRLKKASSISTLKTKADKLWRTVGKEKALCELCDFLGTQINYKQLHPHHVCGRRNMQLRWSLENRCWLCPTHHTLGAISAHNTPRWFNEEFFNKIRTRDYTYIKEKELVVEPITKEFVEECIKKLEDLLTIK